MKKLLLGAALATVIALPAFAQNVVGQVPAGMPCVITSVWPSDDASPNIFWCGPTLAFYATSLDYSNPTNPAVWEAIAPNIGHMVTAVVGPLGPFSIIGSTVMATDVIHVKVQ